MLEIVALAAFRAKEHARAIAAVERYLKEGGRGDALRTLGINARYQVGDHAGVVKDMQAWVQAVGVPALKVEERTLRVVAASADKAGDAAAYVDALELLLAHYPKKDYWLDRLARLQNDTDFADRLLLDLYRLRLATGALDDADQYLEMAQLALKAALPAEARRAVEAGYAAGKLGQGADAAQHQRLRDTATRLAHDDAQALKVDAAGRNAEWLVKTGQLLVVSGQLDQGLQFLELGLAQGGLKWPDDARLRLAQAHVLKGQKPRALELFKAVRAGEGAADLARLWVLHLGKG